MVSAAAGDDGILGTMIQRKGGKWDPLNAPAFWGEEERWSDSISVYPGLISISVTRDDEAAGRIKELSQAGFQESTT